MKPRKRALGLSLALLVSVASLASCQTTAPVVDGLPTTAEVAPAPVASPMPTTTSTAAPPTAAASPAPATPSALTAPVDRVAFRTVATCSNLVRLPRTANKSSPPLPRLDVRSLNATLEMDAKPSYSSVWRGRDGNEGGWRPGRSRLNVSASVVGGGGSPSPLVVSARLHPLPCLPDGASMFGPASYSASTAYRHGPAGEPSGGGIKGGTGGRGAKGDPLVAEVAGLKVKRNSDSSSDVAGSAQFPFLVDYDSAGSVVLYSDGKTGGAEAGGDGSETPPTPVPLACCSLSPPPPDFPEEWSAVIEANVRDRGYTAVVRQLYSASNEKVRLDVHSLGNDRVVIQDYRKGTATFVDAPNSTHPRGSCVVARFEDLDAAAAAASKEGVENVADDGSAPVAAGFSSTSAPAPSSPRSKASEPNDAASFLPTAAALAFAPGGGAARAKFVPSASFDVRGIPVETWHRRVDEPSSNSSYDLLYFFPVNAWLASGERYHRLLKAIVVNGTQGGRRVYQEFHFVDFRPYDGDGGNGNGTRGIPPEAFDPCEIAPGGSGCGCDGRRSRGKGGPAGSGDFGSSFPASASSIPFDENAVAPKAFLPSQVGSYVFFLFLGLVAGLLGAFGIPALVGCCCSGRRRARNFGRFEEGNGGPTAAVTSAA